MTATLPDSPSPSPGPAQPLLQAQHITKQFSGIRALSDVSLDVGTGECVGLIGPNGAGKTTLFDCLSGKLRPDEGEVSFDGRSILGLPIYRRARLGLARTFQRMELFSGMTAATTCSWQSGRACTVADFLRDVIGRSQPTDEEREGCDRVLDLLGLMPDADRPIEALSLGRGRLVELGRALVTEPRLLFLDEPSSGLDRQETLDMGTVLTSVQEDSDLAILLVEHDVPMVQRLTTAALRARRRRAHRVGPLRRGVRRPRRAVRLPGQRTVTATATDRSPSPDGPSEELLRLDKVDAGYGPFRALFGVSFSIGAGTRWRWSGPTAPARPPWPASARGSSRPPPGSCCSRVRRHR